MRLLPFTTMLLALPACGPAGQPAEPLTEAQSAALSPKDARLATIYTGSCKACHTVKDAAAPLAGDRTAWDARWSQGEAALLTSTLQGKGGMPAGGQCFTCSPDELKALIRFMAGRE